MDYTNNYIFEDIKIILVLIHQRSSNVTKVDLGSTAYPLFQEVSHYWYCSVLSFTGPMSLYLWWNIYSPFTFRFACLACELFLSTTLDVTGNPYFHQAINDMNPIGHTLPHKSPPKHILCACPLDRKPDSTYIYNASLGSSSKIHSSIINTTSWKIHYPSGRHSFWYSKDPNNPCSNKGRMAMLKRLVGQRDWPLV